MLVHNQWGQVREAISNAAGIFLFGSLSPGECTLEASKAGFSTLKMNGVLLTARNRRTLSIELQVGPVEAAEVSTITIYKECDLRDGRVGVGNDPFDSANSAISPASYGPASPL